MRRSARSMPRSKAEALPAAFRRGYLLRGRARRPVVQPGCQCTDAGVLEQGHERDIRAQAFPEGGLYGDKIKGTQAHFEEAAVDAYVVAAQDMRDGSGHQPFRLRSGLCPLHPGEFLVGVEYEALPVDFAGAGQGKAFPHQDHAGDQEGGQTLRQPLLELFRRRRRAGPAGHESGQHLARLPAPDRQGGGLFHERMLHEGVLHLAQLDPVTVDLDLIVLTAEEFDIAVGHVAAQVTGGVEVFPCAGVTYEALGRAFGILEVPVGKTVTGDVQFAGDPSPGSRCRGGRG